MSLSLKLLGVVIDFNLNFIQKRENLVISTYTNMQFHSKYIFWVILRRFLSCLYGVWVCLIHAASL